jgi:hypothetical protein
VQELVRFVEKQRRANEEQRRFNEEQRRFNEEQRRFNEEQRRANARYDGFIEEQRRSNEEHRHERKATERRWQKMFLDHEKWMRSHEVRLASHYKLIQDTRDKLR